LAYSFAGGESVETIIDLVKREPVSNQPFHWEIPGLPVGKQLREHHRWIAGAKVRASQSLFLSHKAYCLDPEFVIGVWKADSDCRASAASG
jgi:hypothetical protein